MHNDAPVLAALKTMAAVISAGEGDRESIHYPPTGFRPWMLLIVPTVGGLVSGFLVFRFAPEAEGHGTDAAIAAYHTGKGYIRPRVPLIKLVASVLTIGTGGSGGREGPIAQIGAGFGSMLGGLLRFRVADRRVLVAAGMGVSLVPLSARNLRSQGVVYRELEGTATLTEMAVAWPRISRSAIVQNFLTVARETATNLP